MSARRGVTVAVLSLLVLAEPSLAPAARAHVGVAVAIEETTVEGGGDEVERWWGVLGAALCGAEGWLLRNRIAVGMHPAALTAGLAGCLLAAVDALTTS